MTWIIKYSETAVKELCSIDRQQAKRIKQFMDERVAVSENPKLLGKALVGSLDGFWRFRIGDYRAICEIQNSVVTVMVLHVAHRQNIYKHR